MEIEGYEKIDDLGKGGMAFVYKSRHLSLDRIVALKVMDNKFNCDDSFTKRFQREARISAQLMHKHIVQIYDVGIFQGNNYLSMEYVPNGDLSDLLVQDPPLEENTIVECIKQMASALDFAASKRVVHRDIKPANILVRGKNDFVLADFGIAKSDDVASNLTEVGSIIGTPSYMSPEQSKGQTLDHRSDLYSLGVVFYQLLCNKVPYDGDSALSVGIKHLNSPVPPVIEKYLKYQPVIDKLLAKLPEDRYQSGAELANALDVINDATLLVEQTLIRAPSIDTTATSVETEVLASSYRTKKGIIIALVSLLVVTVVLSFIFLFPDDTQNTTQQITQDTMPVTNVETSTPLVNASTPPTSSPPTSIQRQHLLKQ
ncbi:serine/threonine protein kinase [Colwellia sp. MSW7]|uniref:Serine/threonine protein kinase n=1 Tax=Colwellia maritima TaxID=2912588 RepID=A0ABS9X475_9GAMM|nr:serine/threonine-protein kinase [Colwellia maritima]MCI2285033.1 serine/threonine protein kinase [Colwellia maritima]